jgi:hypothetical protein
VRQRLEPGIGTVKRRNVNVLHAVSPQSKSIARPD